MSQIVGSNNRVYRLVLTGGPNGGKTTGQARLSTFFEGLGWRVFRVPQMLAALTGGGVRASDIDVSEEAWYRLNTNLLRLIIQVETTYFDMASTSTGNCLVICDGGTMDVKARVTEKQWARLMEENRWNDVEMRDSRYNQVVRLVSLPTTEDKDHHQYNLFSMHCAVDAQSQDEIVSQAWVGHPYYDVVDNSTDFEKKIKRMISAVCYRLNIQVGDRLAVDSHKRKFLVSKVPASELFPQFQDFTVVHDYLATANHHMQARVRRRGQNAEADAATPATPVGCIQLDVNRQDSTRVFIVGTDADLNNWTYTHTIRRSQSDTLNSDNPELKMQISPREYELLLGQKDCDRLTVFKTRRCFLWNNQYFQLDIYKEPWPPGCHGLIMLETYTAVKGSEFELPTFLEVLREVTGDPAFSMYNLSKKVTPSDDYLSALEKHESGLTGRSMNSDDVTPMAGAATVEQVAEMSSNRAEENNSKLHLDIFLKNHENNNAINFFCDQVDDHEHGRDLGPSCSFDKLSKWRDAKRKPGSELLASAVL